MNERRQQILDSYYKQLELLLWEALEQGKDLCVYGPVLVFDKSTHQHKMETKYKFTERGKMVDMPCPFTVYHTSHMQTGRA